MVYQVCSNDGPKLTFDLFTVRVYVFLRKVNFAPAYIVWGKC